MPTTYLSKNSVNSGSSYSTIELIRRSCFDTGSKDSNMASRMKNNATFSAAGIAAFLPRTSKKQVHIS